MYTAYNNEFERVDNSPVGSKKEIAAWMKKRFPGLCKKPEPQENGASIFFSRVMWWRMIPIMTVKCTWWN